MFGSRQGPAHRKNCYLCIEMDPPDPRARTLAHLSCSFSIHEKRKKKISDADEPNKKKDGGLTLVTTTTINCHSKSLLLLSIVPSCLQ